MKKLKLLLILGLSAGLLAFTGCQGTSDTTADSAAIEADTDAKSDNNISSTVTIDQTYWAGSNIRVRMSFDPQGNCKYGYIGKYTLAADDNYHLLVMIYYADADSEEVASSTFAIRDNGDGTYTKAPYIDGEEPDFEDTATSLTLTPDEGTDGLTKDAAFDGVYVSSDGQYYSFTSDNTFAMETWMTYVADEEYIELIGADSSTLYTYKAEDAFNKLTLYKDGSTVMELATEAAIDSASEDAAAEESDEDAQAANETSE